MMNLEDRIYDDLGQMNVDIIECDLKANKAIAFEEGYMGVDLVGLSSRERNALLVHEAGHYISGAFYHVFSPLETKSRVEHRARKAAFEKYLTFEELNEAMCNGICNEWELAEHFALPEHFIRKAIEYYTQNRGLCFGDPEGQLTMF